MELKVIQLLIKYVHYSSVYGILNFFYIEKEMKIKPTIYSLLDSVSIQPFLIVFPCVAILIIKEINLRLRH